MREQVEGKVDDAQVGGGASVPCSSSQQIGQVTGRDKRTLAAALPRPPVTSYMFRPFVLFGICLACSDVQ
jgi:hypothetical protein